MPDCHVFVDDAEDSIERTFLLLPAEGETVQITVGGVLESFYVGRVEHNSDSFDADDPDASIMLYVRRMNPKHA